MEKVNLSADGTLDRQVEQPDELEVVIDGRMLTGPAADGSGLTYRSESVRYRLKTFEPQQDGTCVARYVRVNADAL